MSHVWEINDLAELDAYRLAWESLLPQTSDAPFFQSLDWLEAYGKHFGGNQRLRQIHVHRHDP